MSEWTQTDWRIGMWSAMSAATIGAIFVVIGLIGVVARPPTSEPLHQVDPYLAILESLILFAVLLVIMMAAAYAYAPPERKTFSLAALADRGPRYCFLLVSHVGLLTRIVTNKSG